MTSVQYDEDIDTMWSKYRKLYCEFSSFLSRCIKDTCRFVSFLHLMDPNRCSGVVPLFEHKHADHWLPQVWLLGDSFMYKVNYILWGFVTSNARLGAQCLNSYIPYMHIMWMGWWSRDCKWGFDEFCVATQINWPFSVSEVRLYLLLLS